MSAMSAVYENASPLCDGGEHCGWRKSTKWPITIPGIPDTFDEVPALLFFVRTRTGYPFTELVLTDSHDVYIWSEPSKMFQRQFVHLEPHVIIRFYLGAYCTHPNHMHQMELSRTAITIRQVHIKPANLPVDDPDSMRPTHRTKLAHPDAEKIKTNQLRLLLDVLHQLPKELVVLITLFFR